MSVLIKGMEMPEEGRLTLQISADGAVYVVNSCSITAETYTTDAVPVPPHGRLIDADALIADLKRQCKEVFRIDAVSPDDFWITRNQAYNERLWTTWCESLYDYINTAPAIIEAEENSDD